MHTNVRASTCDGRTFAFLFLFIFLSLADLAAASQHTWDGNKVSKKGAVSEMPQLVLSVLGT